MYFNNLRYVKIHKLRTLTIYYLINYTKGENRGTPRIAVPLPEDGCNYRPKHFIANVINTGRYIHLLCCINRLINKQVTWIERIQTDYVTHKNIYRHMAQGTILTSSMRLANRYVDAHGLCNGH
jgi:hypothetical protein